MTNTSQKHDSSPTKDQLCYVKEEGKPCSLMATTRCERCKQPICDLHTCEVSGFFSDRYAEYCPSCEEKHYTEREY